MAGQPGWELFGPWDDERAGPRGDRRAPARSSGCARSAGAPTRPTRSSRAGSRRRCRPSTPARARRRTASGCPRPATRARRRSAAASSRTTSRTTTSRPGTSATASYVKFDHDFIGREALEGMADGEHRHEGHARARRRGRHAHDRHDVPEDRPREVHRLAVGRLLDAPVRPASRSTARPSASRPGSATAPTRARC